MDFNLYIDMDTLRKIIKMEYPFNQELTHAMPYHIVVTIDSCTTDRAFMELIKKKD